MSLADENTALGGPALSSQHDQEEPKDNDRAGKSLSAWVCQEMWSFAMFSQKKIHARRSFDIFVGFVCLAVATAGMVRGLVKAFVVTKFT